jgi:hypothetical protein
MSSKQPSSRIPGLRTDPKITELLQGAVENRAALTQKQKRDRSRQKATYDLPPALQDAVSAVARTPLRRRLWRSAWLTPSTLTCARRRLWSQAWPNAPMLPRLASRGTCTRHPPGTPPSSPWPLNACRQGGERSSEIQVSLRCSTDGTAGNCVLLTKRNVW